MTQRNYQNSRPIDTHRWCNAPEADAWVDELWGNYLSASFDKPHDGRGKPPASTARDQFKVLLLDLFLSWHEDPNQCLGVSHDKANYPVKSRYNALPVTPKLFKLIEELEKKGLIYVMEGHIKNNKEKITTRVWPLNTLVEHFEAAPFKALDIGTLEARETIILRRDVGNKKVLVRYIDIDDPDEPNTDPNMVRAPRLISYMRKRLKAYNELLSDNFIDVACLEEPYIRTRSKDQDAQEPKVLYQRISQHNKRVRRIFNRASFTHGGRLYGGFWQKIGSKLRSAIRIEDEPTVEVDYSAHHIRVAYTNEGLIGPEDPYDLDVVLSDYNGDAALQRSDVKSLTLMALNAKTQGKAIGAFQAKVRKQIEAGERTGEVPKPEFAEALLSLFFQCNPAIEPYMNSDQGIEFMYTDSRISDKIIDHFVKQEIPILSVHDSYLVPAQYENELIEIMNESFHYITGVYNPYIKKEIQTPYQVAQGYLRRREEFKQWREQVDGHR